MFILIVFNVGWKMIEKFNEVLITGGAGFIGSNLVDFLQNISNKIVIIDDLSNGNLGNIVDSIKNKQIKFIKLNITEKKDLEQIFKINNFQVIFHQAALTSVNESFENPILYNNVNIIGSLNLLELSVKYNIEKFVYASSAAIYGVNTETPLKESYIPKPISPYAVNKLTLEYYSNIFNKKYNLDTIGLRYFNVFGPKQNPKNHYSGVIPIFIIAALRDKDIILYGDGSQIRDFVYVDDVCRANINAAIIPRKKNNTYNIGGGSVISIKELAEIIIKITKSNSKITFEKPKFGDIHQSYADISLAKENINYNPKINLEQGLEKAVDYFKKIS